MPQLDILTYQTQFFWVFILFVSLYFLTAKYVLPYFFFITSIRSNIVFLFRIYSNFLSFSSLENSFLNSKNYIFFTKLGGGLQNFSINTAELCLFSPLLPKNYFCLNRKSLCWQI